MEKKERIRELISMTGLSQAKFCERYNIPLRTLEHWIGNSEKRNCPDYVVELLEFKVKSDMEIS